MVKSKVNAALQKIRKILIGVFQGRKQIDSPKVKEQLQPEKEKEGSKGKQVVKNTKAAEVKFAAKGGEIVITKAKRPTQKTKAGK